MNCKRESLCRVLEPIHWSHSGESTWCLAAEDLKGGCRSYLGKKNKYKSPVVKRSCSSGLALRAVESQKVLGDVSDSDIKDKGDGGAVGGANIWSDGRSVNKPAQRYGM